MRTRQRMLLFGLTIAVLLLAAFAMFAILVSIRPLDPEAMRTPGFSSLRDVEVAA
ncbi:hypothetical protein [Parvibaculum sp.]|uniref:hypothetical protein n=1 Tax=Parvibaculum sp. TaxID=2024848 RepID=UPI0027277B1F|nr:hypothetical protein [Parvibaculum sp.]MDO9125412.1 hypothetical protein [Parvibaculum sp.]MDP1627003.1 hypothetical protein [Parvibaculum sp.]MDP2149797.1 hypothetical protein [Parvibaculum sp.]MDP3327241.1 hypothetical protein [Parvibaculum sp.]